MVFCNTLNITNESGRKACHNPYFSRWFSAIGIEEVEVKDVNVTILILVDGFLQSNTIFPKAFLEQSQSLF